MPCFWFGRLIAVWLLISAEAKAEVVFSDGFETPGPAPEWLFANTGAGRAAVTAEYGPATGSAHLVLDDGNNDATFSPAHATLLPNLQNKKNVILSFKAKSIGNEPHPPPQGNYTVSQYDAAAISVDGGITWRSVASLAALGTTWQTFSRPRPRR